MEIGTDIKASLKIHMQTLNTSQYRKTLEKCQIELFDIKDQDNTNLLHQIADSISKQEKLIQYLTIFQQAVKNRYSNSQQILQFLSNQQTEIQKQTPLHYAIRHNRGKLIKEFIRIKADPQIKDINDQGPLHILAMMGYPSLAAYFHLSLGLSLEQKDKNGRTPLHLAALQGHDIIAMYFISQMESYQILDNQNLSPLHLAAYSSNYRIVRHLLMNGADRNIQDAQGITPLQLAVLKGEQKVVTLLVNSIQKPPSLLSFFNPCKPPLKPFQNSKRLFFLFILCFLIRYFLVFFFVLPQLDLQYGIISLSLFLIELSFFTLASAKNPGFTQKSPTSNLLVLSIQTLLQKYIPQYVCPFCVAKRPKKSRHCSHCKRCVRKFDHHCPWIHNCVGEGNHKYFTLFVVFCTLELVYTLSIGLVDYFIGIHNSQYGFFPTFPKIDRRLGLAVSIFSGMSSVIIWPVFYVQVTNLIKQTTTHDRFKWKQGDRARSVDSGNSFQDGVSDSSSMLQREDSEWTPLGVSYVAMSSIMDARFEFSVTKKRKRRCCFGNVQESLDVSMEDRLIQESGKPGHSQVQLGYFLQMKC